MRGLSGQSDKSQQANEGMYRQATLGKHGGDSTGNTTPENVHD